MLTSRSNRQLVVCVGLIEKEGNFLITRRHDPQHSQWHHRWEFPGGKINPGETPLKAIEREIFEETQLRVHSVRLLGVHTHIWQIPEGTQQTFILLYHCQALDGEVQLQPEENDLFLWETAEQILTRTDLLEGIASMLQNLYLNASNFDYTKTT